VRRFDVLTFDCYGTLVDWERGIAEAFGAAAQADGVTLDRAAILRAYHEIEPVVQAERYRRYRDVLAVTARAVADRLGWKLAAGREAFLPESLPSWPPFPDTNAALGRLRDAGYRLAILSNVDDDLLAGTLRRLRVSFDLVVTAAAVRSYKPDPGHFHEARRRIGGRRWLHAAQSLFYDVEPALALGIPVAWINRRGAASAGARRADRECSALGDLADWLTASCVHPSERTASRGDARGAAGRKGRQR
jgi:2-haloacid dehalogenase/putative hydrolase of the HAD superfamily